MSPEDPRHGTRPGYRAHWLEGEAACVPCLRANSRYKNSIISEQDRGLSRKRPPWGVQRRVRALQTLGWGIRAIAREAGWNNTETIVNALRPRTYVTAATFDAIADVYDRLSMQFPPEGNGTSRARNYARRQGWAPPLAWLDIDDPDEVPDFGVDPGGPSHTHVDEVRVLRILNGDMTLAREATNAERHLIVARWPGPLADLERLAGWKPDRYIDRRDGAA